MIDSIRKNNDIWTQTEAANYHPEWDARIEQYKDQVIGLRVAVGLGMVATFLCFYMWYFRVQRYLDRSIVYDSIKAAREAASIPPTPVPVD